MQITVDAHGNKGSITVEASIIVPLVILSIASAIYIGLLLYQRALLQSAAEMACEAGAAAWSSGVNELGAGKPSKTDFEKYSLYRRLFDSEKEDRLQIIEEYALSVASRNELVRPETINAEAAFKDYAVCRKLEVKISSCYNLPLGNFLRLFGGSGICRMNVKAVSTIDEPEELIRTTDFIIDLEKKLEEKFSGIKNLGEQSRNAINEIKQRIEIFMD
ncbi:MAG: TadE/TadG family type IV pilus assembly protein [Bacillota bacterium]